MDPRQPIQRSFYNHWEGGQGHVDIFVQSMPTVTDPQLIDRVQVTFYQQNRCILIGAPPDIAYEELLTPPVHEFWLEDLQAFGSSEQTVAAQEMAAHIRFVPDVPDFVQDYFINVITSQARDAAVTAANLHHRAVRMVIDLNISIIWSYDDDYDYGGDDDHDGGSYADEMDAVAGEADPVVGGAEVDPVAAEGVMGDDEGHPAAAPEEVMGDAEGNPAAPEEAMGDAEGDPAEPAEVVDPPSPEWLAGEAEVIAGIGDIVLVGEVGDPPGDPEDYVPLDTLLNQLIGGLLAPFLELAGLLRRLTPAAIAYHLTVDTFMGGSPQECPICLDGIVTGTPAGWLPCSHVFHPACITNWLERNAACPICRVQLSNNIGD